jgi:group I intron endonuclease
MSIIYCITNKVNGKKYVGQTITTLEKRWKDHLLDSKHLNYYFYKAIRKYGSDCWELEILEETEDLAERERFWIKKLGTFNNSQIGYNCTSGGEVGKKFFRI